jgi:hypothetical protein
VRDKALSGQECRRCRANEKRRRTTKNRVTWEPADGKLRGRWYANVGTVTRADGKKYNVFLTVLRRDLERVMRSFGRDTLLVESAPACRTRFKFEEQPA